MFWATTPRLFSPLPALLLAASQLFNLIAKIGENLASKAPNQFVLAKQTKLTRGSLLPSCETSFSPF